MRESAYVSRNERARAQKHFILFCLPFFSRLFLSIHFCFHGTTHTQIVFFVVVVVPTFCCTHLVFVRVQSVFLASFFRALLLLLFLFHFVPVWFLISCEIEFGCHAFNIYVLWYDGCLLRYGISDFADILFTSVHIDQHCEWNLSWFDLNLKTSPFNGCIVPHCGHKYRMLNQS